MPPGTNLAYLVPTPGDPGPAWAVDIHDALGHIELAHGAVSLRALGAQLDGVTDESDLVAEAIATVPDGGIIVMEGPGILRCSPTAWNTTKTFRLMNPGPPGGEYSCLIKPTADVASDGDPIVYFNGSGSGAGMFGIGIDMTGLTKATGVKVGAGTSRTKVHNLYTIGGYRGWDVRGGNADVIGFHIEDPLDCGFFMDDGAEVQIADGVISRNGAGTTDAYWKIILATGGGPRGSVTMKNVRGTRGLAGTVNYPFLFTAPSLTEVTSFLDGVVLDNCVHAALLQNIQGFGYKDGWINTAAGTEGCVLLDGAYNADFDGNRYRGGSCTYEFTGAQSYGFSSNDNECPTGPLYKLPASNKPIAMYLDDKAPGATDVGQITNDIEGLRAGAGLLWGPRQFMDEVSLRAPVQTAFPAAFVGTMVAGSVEIDAPGAGAAYSWFIPFVVVPGGTRGALSMASINPTGGTGGHGSVTIISTSAGETSQVGYLRLDIPH